MYALLVYQRCIRAFYLRLCVFFCGLIYPQVKKDKKVTPEEVTALEKILVGLTAGKPARALALTAEESAAVKSLMLLTMKPVIYAANVADVDLAKGNEMSKKVFDYAVSEGTKAVIVSAQVEAELAGLNEEERAEFLSTLGVSDENCGLKVNDSLKVVRIDLV